MLSKLPPGVCWRGGGGGGGGATGLVNKGGGSNRLPGLVTKQQAVELPQIQTSINYCVSTNNLLFSLIITAHDPNTEATSAIEKIYAAYKNELKQTYNSIEEAEDSLDVELGIAPRAEFIDLALVHKRDVDKNDPFLKSTLRGGIDDIVASKTPLQMNDILSAESKSQFVLVEGRPGVGKSVFSLELCRQWDTLESLQDYKLVLHLTLRDEYVQESASLQELLHIYSDNSNLCARMEEELTNSKGEGALFILDGFDELPSSIVRDKKSLLMAVVSGKCSKPGRPKPVPFLPKATRLVTSRPSAVNNRCFPKDQRHVEILGFTDDCKERYAEIAFESEPELLEHFKKFIRSNPVINALMHIPLNCAITVQLYRERFENKEQLPKTMTQLYKALIPTLMKRGMVKTGKWDEDTTIPSFTNLLNEVPGLQEVCKLAFDGLMKKDFQLQFTVSAIDNIQCFGLTKKTTTKQRLEKSSVSSFSFLHLSIQEFLAAWYASGNPELVARAISFTFKDYEVYDEKTVRYLDSGAFIVTPHLYNFGLFLSGMIGTKEIRPSHVYFNLHSFFESQGALGDLKPDYELQEKPVYLSTPIDMYVFGYALVHAPGVDWALNVQTSCDALVSCLHDYNTPKPGCICCLEISAGNLSDLIKDMFVILKGLESLTIYSLNKSCKNDHLLFQGIANIPNLWSLTLAFDHITTQGLQELVNLVSHSTTLYDVTFYFGKECSFKSALGFVSAPMCSWYTAERLGLDQLIAAALSCPTVKYLKVRGFPFKLKEHDIPSTSKIIDVHLCNESHHLDSLLEVRLFDWLSEIYSVSDIPLVKLHLENGCFVPPKVFSEIISIINSSLHPSHSCMTITLDINTYFKSCDIKYLSRALRRDPAIPHRTIKRSRSLCDLKVGREYSLSLYYCLLNEKPPEEPGSVYSCPDLLELQSLHMLRDKVREALVNNNTALWLRLGFR